MRNMKLAAAAVTGCIALAACGSGRIVSGEASYFEGLPHSVVAEFLGLPIQQRNLAQVSGDAGYSLAQAGVRNMIFCREELHVYRRWLATGQPPAIVRGPVPVHPLEPGNAAIRQDYARLESVTKSGRLSRLRFELTANGSCGQWVPAKPGTRKPTIARVVRNRGA